jgi:FAD/FMN-containing dehydrogenase
MITTTHHLLTQSWTVDVEAMEAAVAQFPAHRPVTNDCRVALFEIAGDGHLHVNVTHRYRTQAASGWAGPAVLRQGFVHNRIFGDTPRHEIVRRIREMVFSARI